MPEVKEMMEATLAYCRSHECYAYGKRQITIGVDKPISGDCELSDFCLGPTPPQPDGKKHIP